MNKLLKDSIVLITGRAISFFISIITPIVLVRVLTVSDYGKYRQILLVITTLAAMIPIGLHYSLAYFFPHDSDNKGDYLSVAIIGILLNGILVTVLLYVFSDHISNYFNNTFLDSHNILIGMIIIVYALSSLVEIVLIVDKEVRLSTIILVSTRILQSTIFIVAVCVSGLYALFLGFLILLTLKSVYSIGLYSKNYELFNYSSITNKLSSNIKYAFPLGLGGIFLMISETIDKFMVSHYLSEKSFAIYAVGCYELPLITMIFSSIGDVVLPHVVAFKKNNDKISMIKTWHYAIEKSMFVGIPFFLIFFMFSYDFIVTMFTEKYIESVEIFRISLFTILLEATRYGMITRTYAKTMFMLYVSSITTFVMVICLVYLIKLYGVMGAVIVFVITRLIMVFAEIIYSKILLSVKYKNILPFKYMFKVLIFSFISIVPALIIHILLDGVNNIFRLILEFGVFFVIYAFITHVYSYWSVDALSIPGYMKNYFNRIDKYKVSTGWLMDK